MAVGLNLYLGSQSICIVDFGFPTMGDPMLSNPNALLFPYILLFISQSHSFSLLVFSPPSFSNAHSSFSYPIYRLT